MNILPQAPRNGIKSFANLNSLFPSFIFYFSYHSTHHVSMASFDYSPVRMWIQFQRWSIVRVVWIELFILLHVLEHIYKISNKTRDVLCAKRWGWGGKRRERWVTTKFGSSDAPLDQTKRQTIGRQVSDHW